jgi:hypothetical protein
MGIQRQPNTQRGETLGGVEPNRHLVVNSRTIGALKVTAYISFLILAINYASCEQVQGSYPGLNLGGVLQYDIALSIKGVLNDWKAIDWSRCLLHPRL